MSNSLPQQWAISTVGECFLEIRNGTTEPQNKSGAGIPISRIETIQDSKFDLNRLGSISNLKPEAIQVYCYRPGDIAFSHINSFEHVGKSALYKGIPELLIHGMNLLRLRPCHAYIEPMFAHFFMQTAFFRDEVRQRVGHAVNQVSINQKNLANVPFIVAPLDEQRRIVAKLEKLLDKVDSCQKRLARIPVLFKRFRESVLAAACSGRLTADWREENRNADSLTIDNVGSLPDGNDCPNEWRIANLGALVKLVTSGSRGWAKYYAESGAVFIRAQNINSDVLSLDEVAYVQLPKRSEGIRTKVQLHDILITITGANVTKSALVEREIGEVYVNQHVALVRLNDVRFSKFVFLSLISPMHGRQQLKLSAYGQGKPGLNLDNIRSVVLTLPSLSEQEEIVTRVNQLFILSDQVEARYAKAKQYVDSLKQSILAKAFRGELVPQDPNDEPATILLERIREARATQQPRPSVKRTKKSRSPMANQAHGRPS